MQFSHLCSSVIPNPIGTKFASFSSSTSSLRKIRYKTQMRAPIGLKFDTLEGLIKSDLSTNFGRNPMNIHGIVKPSHYDAAVSIFLGSGVLITAEGKRHLGAALGTTSFVSSFVNQNVSVWKHELEVLADL